MAYFSELRAQWRPLLGATLGLGSGFSLASLTTSTIAPSLGKEFGWTASDFAMVGSLSIIVVLVFPFVGRLADVIGVKRTALIGILTLPVTYLAYSLMAGNIRTYIAIFLVQACFCITTTSTVWSRVVVEYIKNARGLALAVVASGPALTGLLGTRLLNWAVETYGWRVGYQGLALFSIVAGVSALLIIPQAKPGPSERITATGAIAQDRPRRAKQDYGMLIRHPGFWVLLFGLLFCNLFQTIYLTQLKFVLLANGLKALETSIPMSAFWAGQLTGRFVAGFALDRYKPHLVAAISLGLPGLGLFMLASPLDSFVLLTVAMTFIGLAVGAEGDIVGFLVVRIFGVGIYSSVLGLMTMAIAASTAIGAIMLRQMMGGSNDYNLFLCITGTCSVLGSLLFLLLPLVTRPAEEAELAASSA